MTANPSPHLANLCVSFTLADRLSRRLCIIVNKYSDVAQYTALEPPNALGWVAEAAVKATELAAFLSTQAMKYIAEGRQGEGQQ